MSAPDTPDLVSPFDALMEAAVDAIIIIDGEGRIQRFNRAAESMFGYTESEVCGQNVSRLMPEPHSSQHGNYLKRYEETGEPAIIGTGREESGRRKDGSIFPMQLSVGEIRQPGGSRYVGIVRDLSGVRDTEEQLRQLENQLLHADRLVILGELTAGIAHEINQPLTAIAAYADAGCSIVRRQNETAEDELQTICERIGQQSRRAAEVVQRLRTLVRSGKVAKAHHDVNQIVRNILLLFEYELKKTNTDLIFHPLEPLEQLYVDEIQIQQIMVNLVKNSLDALAETPRPDGRIEIDISRTEGQVVISVLDNGPGVPESIRSRLFESFFTTKPKGVGLGLSICRNIAAAHGGNLVYENAPGGGSRFTLTLPLKFIG
ncbi:MAG: PAS domain S-box protein [Gammaproteobacteria bacterium]|nr:PAS domain S-box protein [Gammaproteobacteria bacterium]NNK34336.1 PAS domain S-box protein [Xanthomonadales bacterium]